MYNTLLGPGERLQLYREESAAKKYTMRWKKERKHWQTSIKKHFQHHVASPTNAVNEIDTSRQRKTPD